MRKKIVGIIDFSLGNHESLSQMIKNLGFGCFVSFEHSELEKSDLLILPGVGAFEPAMANLKSKQLDQYLICAAKEQRAILGICLGMQMLASCSDENGETDGLNIIPGRVRRLASTSSHIGWNSIVKGKADFLSPAAYQQNYYFNHSYAYECSEEYIACTTIVEQRPVAAAIKSKNVIGLQFHPEKSQTPGKELLRVLMKELTSA